MLHYSPGERELAVVSTAENPGLLYRLSPLYCILLVNKLNFLPTLGQVDFVPLSPFSFNSSLIQHALELLSTPTQWKSRIGKYKP
jgi:hypothetical protein